MYVLNAVYERSCDEEEETRIHTANAILYQSNSYETLYNKMLEQVLDDITISYEDEIEEISELNKLNELKSSDYMEDFFNDMKDYIQYNLSKNYTNDKIEINNSDTEKEYSEDETEKEDINNEDEIENETEKIGRIIEKKWKKIKLENNNIVENFSSIYRELLDKIFIRIEKNLLKIRVLDFYMYEIINLDKIEIV